jgi:hypothetical protein
MVGSKIYHYRWQACDGEFKLLLAHNPRLCAAARQR